jgi:hypothetical protein
MEAAAVFFSFLFFFKIKKKKGAHFDPMMLWLLFYTVCKRERVSRLVRVERRGTAGNRGMADLDSYCLRTQSMMFFSSRN